jgi:RHS repeat-associated protein
LDDALALYDYRARYYDPALGRFTQPDTIVPKPGNPQALNRYAYVNNNPLKYTDPSGHWLETAWDILNIAWDLYEVRRDPSLLNIGALVVDVGAAVLPFVPASVGMVVRGGKAAKAAVEVVSHADEVVDAGRVVAEVASHADEAADALRAADEATDALRGVENTAEVVGNKPPIVIGEDMARVREYAKQIGGHAYRPWRNDPFDFDLALQRNERWIKDQMRQGREIVDIGPAFARRARTGYRSPFYELERRLLREWDYERYRKVFERFGDIGGVPGLDY